MREEITRASYSNHNCKYTVVIEWAKTFNFRGSDYSSHQEKVESGRRATKLKCEFCPSVEELI